jgi:hypothetical protein
MVGASAGVGPSLGDVLRLACLSHTQLDAVTLQSFPVRRAVPSYREG